MNTNRCASRNLQNLIRSCARVRQSCCQQLRRRRDCSHRFRQCLRTAQRNYRSTNLILSNMPDARQSRGFCLQCRCHGPDMRTRLRKSSTFVLLNRAPTRVGLAAFRNQLRSVRQKYRERCLCCIRAAGLCSQPLQVQSCCSAVQRFDARMAAHLIAGGPQSRLESRPVIFRAGGSERLLQ